MRVGEVLLLPRRAVQPRRRPRQALRASMRLSTRRSQLQMPSVIVAGLGAIKRMHRALGCAVLHHGLLAGLTEKCG